MSARWEDLPNPRLWRVEMWCAREWAEAKEAALRALAAPAKSNPKDYARHKANEHEWFQALLVVNRVQLGIEPLRGDTFLDGTASPRKRVG